MSLRVVIGILIIIMNLAAGLWPDEQLGVGYFNVLIAVIIAFFVGAQWEEER